MKHNRTIGFTLIELLVVVALLGILSSGILIALNITGTIGKATLTQAKKFAASLENGLAVNQVGKWSFEEPSGDALDTSGYSKNGTLMGNVETTPNCDNIGLGRCLTLDGVGDFVGMNTKVVNNAASFTVAVWIRPTAVSGSSYPSIVSEIGNPNEPGQFNIRITDAYKIDFFRRPSTTGGVHRLVTNTAIKLGQWYHIVGVNLAGTLQIYINSVKDSAVQADSSWGTGGTTATRIGYDNNGYFKGSIDEVQIYNQAFTLSRIRELYAQGVIRIAMAYR